MVSFSFSFSGCLAFVVRSVLPSFLLLQLPMGESKMKLRFSVVSHESGKTRFGFDNNSFLKERR